MRTIDCFPYNGECIALFRLAYLWDVVDEFIIVEARETHAGEKKRALFLETNAAALKPFESKITPLIVEQFPEPTEDALAKIAARAAVADPRVWFKESYQRSYPGDYLRDLRLDSPWLLFCCDADEIPRRETVSALRGHYDALAEPHHLEMALFYYSTEWIKRNHWYNAYVVNDQGLQTESLDEMRVHKQGKKVVSSAGWHLSYFMTEDEIQRKVRSFAHTEVNTAETRNLEWIRQCRRTGRDLYRPGAQNDCVRYEGDDLPQNLREFELAHGIRGQT